MPISFDLPEVAKLDIKVAEVESLIWQKEQRTYQVTLDSHFSELIECTNPQCSGGGVSIGPIIREIVGRRSEDVDEAKSCSAMEKSGRRCMHAFLFSGKVQYKK